MAISVVHLLDKLCLDFFAQTLVWTIGAWSDVSGKDVEPDPVGITENMGVEVDVWMGSFRIWALRGSVIL